MSEMLLITGHAKHLAVSVSLWVNNDRDCDSAFIVALSGNLIFFPNSLRPVLCPFFKEQFASHFPSSFLNSVRLFLRDRFSLTHSPTVYDTTKISKPEYLSCASYPLL